MKNENIQLENYLSGRLGSGTVGSYLYIINRFLNLYPKASRLSLRTIEGYCKQLKDKGAGARYRGVVIAAIKAYYDYLLDAGIITEHPCKYLKTETKPTGTNFNNFLTMEEMEQLFKVKEHRYPRVFNRDRAIIGVLIYQGVTREELATLKVKDVDFDAGTIHITGCRKNRSRTLALRPTQVPILMAYINEERKRLVKDSKTDNLFISMRALPMTPDSVHAFVNRMQGAFNKELSPTNIRNSVISYWLNERGFPLEDVQIMAGHRYPSSTERYQHDDTEEQRAAVTELHQMIFA